MPAAPTIDPSLAPSTTAAPDVLVGAN
jgi:hypothetical protein